MKNLVVVKRKLAVVAAAPASAASAAAAGEGKHDAGGAGAGEAVSCTCLDSAAQVLYMASVSAAGGCDVLGLDLRRSEVVARACRLSDLLKRSIACA